MVSLTIAQNMIFTEYTCNVGVTIFHIWWVTWWLHSAPYLILFKISNQLILSFLCIKHGLLKSLLENKHKNTILVLKCDPFNSILKEYYVTSFCSYLISSTDLISYTTITPMLLIEHIETWMELLPSQLTIQLVLNMFC